MATGIGQYAPIFLPGDPSPPWQRSLAGHRLQGRRESDVTEATLRADTTFFCLWQLCPGEGWLRRWCSCVAFGDRGGAYGAETRTASAQGSRPSQRLPPNLLAGDQRPLWPVLLLLRPFRPLEGCRAWGPAPKTAASGTQRGAWWGPTLQLSVSGIWWAGLSLFSHWWLACGETEATVTAPPPTVTQRCHLAPVAAWLSSTGVSHHDLLPHIPSTRRAAVSSIPHPGVAPQSPKSSSQPLRLPGDQPSCPGYVRLQQGLFNSHSIQSATDRLFHAQP